MGVPQKLNTACLPSVRMIDDLSKLHDNAILDIKAKITQRQDLSRKITRSLERMIVRLNGIILRAGGSLGVAGLDKRGPLEAAKTSCQQSILHEELACWRDVATLETELRELQRQRALLNNNNNGNGRPYQAA